MSESNSDLSLYDEQLTQEWKHDLQRTIRRSEIYREFPKWSSDYSVNEIKARVREHEERLGTNDMIEGLVSGNLELDSKMKNVARAVYESLNLKFPEVSAIVIAGSVGNGGYEVRKATNASPSDFDWGVVVDQYPDNINRLTETGNTAIIREGKRQQLGKKFGPCKTYSPRKLMAFNLQDEKDAYNKLQKLGQEDLSRWEKEELLSPMTLYLLPSYPQEVNQKNRILLIKGLQKLAIYDPEKWRRAVDAIALKWEEYHVIKEKHIKIPDPKIKDWKLRRRVALDSSIVMGAALKEILESSGRAE